MQEIENKEALDDKTKSHLKKAIGVQQQYGEEEETTNDNHSLI